MILYKLTQETLKEWKLFFKNHDPLGGRDDKKGRWVRTNQANRQHLFISAAILRPN